MDKLGKTLSKNAAKHSYRLLSVAHLTVNRFAIPTANKAMTFIQNSMKNVENDDKLSIIKNVREGMLAGHNIAMKPLETIGDFLGQSITETEKRIREEHQINTNQWLFSLDNLAMLEKVSTLADLVLKDVQHVNRMNSIRYLSAWTMLQGLYLTSYENTMVNNSPEQLDFPAEDPQLYEFQQIQEECLYFSSFAHGTYGKLLNYLFKEKRDINRLARYTNYTEDFIFHTKVPETDVLHYFWNSTIHQPAHVIAKDRFKQTIILCMRGTAHWADAITDLDFHYLSFSIIKDHSKGQCFLKFHYTEDSQDYLRKKLGEDTRDLNGEIAPSPPESEEIIVTGYAHAGMLASAIGAYKEISPKLENILLDPEHANYNLVVTGHSLGGGMSTLMTLLYLVHPLIAIKGRVYEKLSGYSFGGASVLSLEFDKYMQNLMKTVILGYDIVPRLSYGSAKDMCRIILAFDELNNKDPNALHEMTNFDIASELSQQNQDTPQIKRFKSLYENFRLNHMTSLKLFPMGRVFHIMDFKNQKVKRGNYYYDFIMREIKEKEFFDEILFSRNLVTHHFPHLYEEALSSNKVLYQDYLHMPVNKDSTAENIGEVMQYTR